MKKSIAAALTAALAVTAAGNTSSSAIRYTPEELNALGSFLLGKSAVGSADLNSDSVCDIFDMVAMRRSFTSSSGEFKDTVVAPTEEYVNMVNRNVFSEGTAWLVQSGGAVEFNVSRARSVTITLKGDGSEKNDADHRPRYAILVNNDPVMTECLSESEKEITVFDIDTPIDAEIKVIHLSEANNGAVGVSSIKVNSDSVTPIAPTPEKDLYIEFVGDSITCAYGVEGKDQYEGFKTSTENFMKSYAYLTAEKLGAEYSTACYSGYGVVSAYSSDGSRNTSGLLGDCYDYAAAQGSFKVHWDHISRPVDVVVVNLGTNDNTYVSKDYEKRGPEFTEKYVELLAKIHKAQPEAAIICTVGTMGCSEMFPYIEDAVEQFRRTSSMGDRITAYLSATQDMNSDGLGSDWHPTYTTQQKAAAVLADKICRMIGRESDQVGLDVSADAEFTAALDKKVGADAATYFSEYDRSFWVNVVTGGSDANDVQAVLSPIGLKKNGKYNLSFSATAPEGSSLPVEVRNKDGSRIYFRGTFVSKGEKTPFEADFICPDDVSDGEFALFMGGKDYTSVTIYSLKLIKTA